MKKINWWNLKLKNKNIRRLEKAFSNKNLSCGPITKNVETKIQNILNTKYTTLTTSGSVALLIALKSLRLKKNSEVIVPNRTFQATANAVVMAGLKAKLVDTNSTDGTISFNEVKKSITKKTSAIIAVHLNGRHADIIRLKKLCKKNKIFLIEDAAQAFYSKYKKKYLGTFGDIGCFSFGVTKFLTTGQGGLVTTQSKKLHLEIKKYLFHAQSGSDLKTFKTFGFNFRSTDLLNSLACEQLNDLDVTKKKFIKVYSFYLKELKNISGIKMLESNIKIGEVPIWIEVLTPNRDELFLFLKSYNIETFKFYLSLNKSPYLKQKKTKYPNSDLFEKQGLILPCGPDISISDCRTVIKYIKKFFFSVGSSDEN